MALKNCSNYNKRIFQPKKSNCEAKLSGTDVEKQSVKNFTEFLISKDKKDKVDSQIKEQFLLKNFEEQFVTFPNN